MASSDFADDGPTDPFRTLDPEQRLALHGEVTGDDLIAAVLADPDNDEPRLVYGDYLLERGDPRGEFIQLQLQHEHSYDDSTVARERELLAAHGVEWCAPLYEALDPASIVFRRGFLWRCRTQDRMMALRDVIGHPMWRTVGVLESTEERLLVDPCTRSTKHAITTSTVLGALAVAPREVGIVRVELLEMGRFRDYGHEPWRDYYEGKAWPQILDVGRLTQVRALVVRADLDAASPGTRELLGSRFGHQLATLELYGINTSLAPWVPIVRDHPTLRRLVVHPGELHGPRELDRGGVVLERDEHGNLGAVLEIDRDLRTARVFDMLASLPAEFRSVEIAGLDGPLLEVVTQNLIDQLERRFADVIIRTW